MHILRSDGGHLLPPKSRWRTGRTADVSQAGGGDDRLLLRLSHASLECGGEQPSQTNYNLIKNLGRPPFSSGRGSKRAVSTAPRTCFPPGRPPNDIFTLRGRGTSGGRFMTISLQLVGLFYIVFLIGDPQPREYVISNFQPVFNLP